MIWTEDQKLLTFCFCLFLICGLLIINSSLSKINLKKTTTHFQLKLSVLSYIKLLLVFTEFSKIGDK